MSSLPTSYPYIASAQKKYRSPHAQDLSFPKGATIRVLALAPKSSQGQEDEDDDDDEDDIWLVGELKDGTAKGTFPANCVVLADEQEEEASEAAASTAATQSQDDEPTASAPSISEAATIAAASDEPPAAATQATSAPAEPTDKGVEEPAPTPAPVKEDDTAAAAAAPSASSPAAVTSPTPSAAAAAPATKAGPPPPKPKPSGLAARIAAFNQPQQQQSSAPPPSVPRGGGWKRPAPKEGEKPVLPGAPPAVAAKPAAPPSGAAAPQPDAASPDAPTDVHNASAAGRTNEGFSAADAASSIKMSLKERMAALQRGGSESSSNADAPSAGSGAKSPPPLAAKPGRLTKERSAAALGSIGGPGVGSQESLGVPLAKTGSRGSMDSERERTVKSPSAAVTDDAGTAAPIEEGQEDDEPSAAPAEGDVAAAAEPAAESEEPSEEEPEAQRRAAIAQRMARLGGQRFGGSGPAMFGAPKPPAPAKKASMASVGSAASAEPAPPSMVVEGAALSEEPAADVATASAADSALSEPAAAEEDKPNTLAVPRRAAPPRKKRSGQPSPGASQDDNMGAADSASASEPTATGDASVPSAAAAEEPHEREGPIDAEKEAAISREAQKQVEEAPVAKDAITETAPPPPASSDNAEEEGDDHELVSGPPPPSQAVHTEKVAGEVKSAERVAQLGHEDEDQPTSANVDEVNDAPAAPQDDEALQRQTAQLNSFLRDPSRQQSSSSVFTTGSRRAPSTKSGLGGEEGEEVDVQAGEESGSEGGAIPAALAQQLGLTSARKEEPEEAEAAQEKNVLREEPEQHERETEQERPASPPAHRRMSSSSRPPIPTGAGNRTSIPPPARTAPTPVSAPSGEERVASPATMGRPPVPRSPPPPARSPSIGLGGAAAAAVVGGAGISEVLHRAGQSEDDESARPAAPTPLAAPRPRHAIPTEEEEDEDGHNREASADVDEDVAAVTPAAAEEEEAQAAEAEPEEEPELTEEEQEAARRAAIAKRMAALGGQRMGGLPPIMGAPMPPRRKQTSDSAAGVQEEESSGRTEEEAPAPVSRKPGAPPRGGMAIPGMTTREAVEPEEDEDEDEVNPAAAGDGEEEVQDVEEAQAVGEEEDDEPLQRVSSPPVKPMSPPPVPTSTAPPPRVPASPAPRAPMSPPPRPPSSGARPPIPQAQQQRRQSSIENSLSGVGGYEEDDEDQLGGQASPPQRLASPPPPPRAPPRAPPVAPAQTHGRRPSEASLPSIPSSDAPIAAAAAGGAPMATSMSAQQSTSPRDLDLRPSTHWWRRQPLELPPTISARPDATVLSLDRAPDGSEMRIVVLFEDNSTTTIRIVMRGDADGEEDVLEQSHSSPPPLPRDEEEAKRWSSTVGVAVAKEALLALQQNKGSAPSSSSYGLLASLLHTLNASSRTPPTHRPLPPVSPSSLDSPATPYGLVVFSQVGSTTLERGPDATPRPGDIVVLAQGAEFKGKRSVGLGSYHDTYKGTCAAVVVEWDSKKRRCKVVGVLPKGGSGTGGAVEETTLRLDDVKAGVVRVVRVPPVAWLGL